MLPVVVSDGRLLARSQRYAKRGACRTGFRSRTRSVDLFRAARQADPTVFQRLGGRRLNSPSVFKRPQFVPILHRFATFPSRSFSVTVDRRMKVVSWAETSCCFLPRAGNPQSSHLGDVYSMQIAKGKIKAQKKF